MTLRFHLRLITVALIGLAVLGIDHQRPGSG